MMESDIATAVATITSKISDTKRDLREIFLTQQSKYADVLSLFSNYNNEERYTICDNVLGVDAESRSEPKHVLECLVKYEIAMSFASAAKQNKSDDNIKDFYKHHLHGAVVCAWEFVCRSSSLVEDDCCQIALCCGRHILGINENEKRKMVFPHIFPYQKFTDLYKVIKRLRDELITKSLHQPRQKISINPTLDKVKSFIRNLDQDTNDRGGKSYSNSTSSDEGSHHGISNQYFKSFFEAHADNTNESIERASTYSDLLQFMPKTYLDDHGIIATNRDDWNIFINSPLLMASVVESVAK